MPTRTNPNITPLMLKMLPWIAAIAFFMQTLDTSILNTALPVMAKDLNESALNMQSAVICYALTLALFIPVSGFLSDRFGTRNVFIFALTLFSLGSFCSSSSPTLFWLDLSRIIQGMGGAMMVPVSRLALIETFERNQFLEALNTSTLLGLVGPFLGPLLGGYLVEKANWHWIFLINVPIGIIGIIASMKFMPNVRGKNLPLDIGGVLLVSLAFITMTMSLELVSENIGITWAAPTLIFGVFLLFMYVVYAKRNMRLYQKTSIFPLQLFAVRTFKIGLFGNFVCRLGSQAIPFLMPLLLQLVFGYSAIESGLMLTPIAIAAIIMKKLVTPILRRFGYRSVLITSTAFVGGVIVLLAFCDIQSSPQTLVILLFLLGFINSLRFTAMSSITLADLYNEQTSSGNSLMSVSQQLAITFGVALGSVLVRVFQYPDSWLSFDLLYAFKATFTVLGIFTCLSSLAFYGLSSNDGNNLTDKHVHPSEL